MQSLLSRSILHHVNRRTNCRIVTFAADHVVVTFRSFSSAAAAESNTTKNSSNTASSTGTSTTTTNNRPVENEWMKGALQQLLEQYGNQLKMKDGENNHSSSTTTTSVTNDSFEREQRTKKEVTDEDLEKSLQYFQVRISTRLRNQPQTWGFFTPFFLFHDD